MSEWADFLQEGKFDGITFDFVSTREAHSNELDVREYPGRDGAFVEKRRRKPIRMTIMAVFIDDDYPQKMWDLDDKLSDGTPKEFVHPIHGTINAACESHEVVHDAEDPDSGMIQMTLVEHTEQSQLIFQNRPTIAAKANETRSNADAINVNAEGYVGAVLAVIEETVSTAVAVVDDAYVTAQNIATACIAAADTSAAAATNLEENGDGFSAVEIQAVANQALAQLDAQVAVLADYATEEAYNLSRALLDTASSLGTLATILVSAKPPLIVEELAVDTPLLVYAHETYGDSSRVGELLTLNSIPDPLLVPAGFQMRRYAV